jgi:D-glycero-D-manno-heptose 1,7-bisphosphate phosphatase
MIDAVFLDRDGVLNVNRADYVKSRDELIPLPGAAEAVARLTQAGIPVFLISNQSGIGRGVFTEEALTDLTQHLIGHIESAGGMVHQAYYCLHKPDHGCDCRKPKPGLLHQAAQDHTLDLSNTVFIGDTYTDIIAGQAVGCTTILVLSGRGEKEIDKCKQAGAVPDHIAKDLAEAVEWLFQQENKKRQPNVT